MFPHKLLICFLVLGLTIGTTCMVGAETSSAGQDQVIIVPPDSQNNPEKADPQEQYQFISPGKSSTESKFLILDQDGKTPSDYHQLLDSQDQVDKKPGR